MNNNVFNMQVTPKGNGNVCFTIEMDCGAKLWFSGGIEEVAPVIDAMLFATCNTEEMEIEE